MTPIPLIVIDMQKKFSASSRALRGCVDLAERTVKAGKPVYLVEYHKYGKTRKQLRDISNREPIIKTRDDGSWVIAHRLRTIDAVKHRTVRICGVNTSACVARTAAGLVELGYRVRVALSGCADDPSWGPDTAELSRFWSSFHLASRRDPKPNTILIEDQMQG